MYKHIVAFILVINCVVFSANITPLSKEVVQSSPRQKKQSVSFQIIRDKEYEGKKINWHFGYVYYDEFCRKVVDINDYTFSDIKELLIKSSNPSVKALEGKPSLGLKKVNDYYIYNDMEYGYS